mmetsp:Transcript_37149/g.90063  ORF Transcript_37149/g.90063 Transcript_37149/m.90063 type:complete len:596 (+) Transcript_37149:275-2062(+)
MKAPLLSSTVLVILLAAATTHSYNAAPAPASAFVATTSVRNNNNNYSNNSFRSRPRSSRGCSMLFVATPSGLTAPAPATQTTQIDDGRNSNHNHQQESDEQSTTENTADSTASAASKEVNNNRKNSIDRPLLRDFGKHIDERVLESTKGQNLFDLVDVDHFTSDETIPILDMKSDDVKSDDMKSKSSPSSSSTRREIRKAYTASDTENSYRNNNNNDNGSEEQEQEREKGWVNGRSSGSGCTIIRLKGKDAVSVKGLADFADMFFVGVDDESRNAPINDVGVFRIANNVHAGFDKNVENDGKMQVLYTKIIPGDNINDDDDDDSEEVYNGDSGGSSMLLPLEVGDLVGTSNLDLAHKGMNTLLDIGSQITSAVLGMDESTIDKLLDDCTHSSNDIINEKAPDHSEERVANSYLRVIRYLEPHIEQEDTTAFWPHVDSTFLTLIPMTTIPGLEVWCPSSSKNTEDSSQWVRPTKGNEEREDEDDCTYVVALAGEFMQLLSDGAVPTCIHRVIPPQAPIQDSTGFTPKYIPRVSAPMFIRPRRGEEATLDVQSDLRKPLGNDNGGKRQEGMYFQHGLMEEINGMSIWKYMDCMSPNN